MAERVQARDHERLSRAVSPRRTEALAAWTAAVREAARARGRAPLLVEMGPELFGRLLGELDGLLLRAAASRAGPLLAQEEAGRRLDELERPLAPQNDLARILSPSTSLEEAMRGGLGAARSAPPAPTPAGTRAPPAASSPTGTS